MLTSPSNLLRISKLSCQWFKFSQKVKVIRSNSGYLFFYNYEHPKIRRCPFLGVNNSKSSSVIPQFHFEISWPLKSTNATIVVLWWSLLETLRIIWEKNIEGFIQKCLEIPDHFLVTPVGLLLIMKKQNQIICVPMWIFLWPR